MKLVKEIKKNNLVLFNQIRFLPFQNTERKCNCSPVNFSKPRYVGFQHLCKHFHIKVLLHTLLGAEVLQNASDVRQKHIVQRAACKSMKDASTKDQSFHFGNAKRVLSYLRSASGM